MTAVSASWAINPMSQELIPITAQVGDRSYRIKVEPKDEDAVRRTLEQIDQKLREFKTNFAGKDMQDYLAMTLLWYATLPAPATAGSDAPAPLTPAPSTAQEESALARELAMLEQLLDTEINKR